MPRPSTSATIVGAIAVLIWSTLALLTDGAKGIPPLQLLSMTFGIAFFVGYALLRRSGENLASLRDVPLVAWGLGATGLAGYHFFYFVALANAPVVDASLIAYLWPLLIVVFSALLPEQTLRWFHILGASLGLIGAALLIVGDSTVDFRPRYSLGYAAAIACALIWSGYSVLNRRFAAVRTQAVTGYCAVVSVLAFLAHLAFESSVSPTWSQAWHALALGLGPIGAALYFWDYGTKHGDLPVLGTLAYGAPLLSTLLLIVFGRAEPTWTIGLACLLIGLGALIASARHWRTPTPPPDSPPPAE
ncbi:MAG: EamA family transporter [Pseudomonadota bacterium]